MSENSDRMAEELVRLNYQPKPFKASENQGGAYGVQFDYQIEDGSRAGETVTLGLVLHPNEGVWPEVAPHWLYLSPPDDVLAELVKGSTSSGVVDYYEDENQVSWMVISAPPNDFWDQIEMPYTKSMRTYLDRHVRRIWRAR